MESKALAGVSVLIVEDDPDFADGLAAFLQLEGAEVASVSWVTDALKVLTERPIAVVLTDLGLPDQDGYALLKAVRDIGIHTDNRPLAVVALTGYATGSDRAKVAAAGFDLHLTKPVDPRAVALAVRMCADRQSPRSRVQTEQV